MHLTVTLLGGTRNGESFTVPITDGGQPPRRIRVPDEGDPTACQVGVADYAYHRMQKGRELRGVYIAEGENIDFDTAWRAGFRLVTRSHYPGEDTAAT